MNNQFNQLHNVHTVLKKSLGNIFGLQVPDLVMNSEDLTLPGDEGLNEARLCPNKKEDM